MSRHQVPQEVTTSGSMGKLTCLVFSKDRAMQLCAALESFFARCRDSRLARLCVLYRASDDASKRQYEILKDHFTEIAFIEEHDFKRQTTDVLAGGDHVLFMVDDNVFVRDFCLRTAVDTLLRWSDALGFSLRLGRNTVHNYSRNVRMTSPDFTEAAPGVVKYNWTRQQHDFGYPLEISSSVYRTADILPLLEQLDFSNPNLLEGLMAANARLYAARRPCLLCFDLSVAFCNPLNMVQSVCVNRTGGDNRYSAEKLAALFDDGRRIDVAEYNGLIPSGCHQDVELRFRQTAGPTDLDKPLVTVEMVAYNAEHFIRQAIASVLAQTYTNIELLIMDDGSTDRTPDIVASFNDGRIRYLRNRHEGRWTQTNRAIAEAKGVFIMAVDSDDYIAPDYVEKMVACAVQRPDVDFFYPAELYLVDEDNRHTGARWQYDDFSDNRILPRTLFARGNSPIPYPGSLRRMSMFEKTGLYEELPNAADYVFLCRHALKVNFKRVDRHATYFYRTLPTSLSQNYGDRARTVAHALSEMVSIYDPEVLCPQLTGAKDESQKEQQYYSYLTEMFAEHGREYRSAEGAADFMALSDHYRKKLLETRNTPTAASISISRNPLATVEMVTFNGQRHIARAIESVLSQTCAQFELVIVDDGSTDATPQTVERYHDGRIRYIRQPHKNAATARNRVLSETRGEFLLCVDSDDFIEPDYLEKMLQCAAQNPDCDYFYPASLTLVDAHDATIGEWKYSDLPDSSILPSWLFFHGASPIPNPGSLKRRSLFSRTGPYDDLDTVEDFAFLCRNALKIAFKRVDRHARYFYRRLDQSLSRRAQTRDRITADLLNRMVAHYPPEVVCPRSADFADADAKTKFYYAYLQEIFYKHAGGYHMVKHGEHFRRYGDHYRMQLEMMQHRLPAGPLITNRQGA